MIKRIIILTSLLLTSTMSLAHITEDDHIHPADNRAYCMLKEHGKPAREVIIQWNYNGGEYYDFIVDVGSFQFEAMESKGDDFISMGVIVDRKTRITAGSGDFPLEYLSKEEIFKKSKAKIHVEYVATFACALKPKPKPIETSL